MFTEIRDITVFNKEEMAALRIADDQEGFIESTQQCLQEAENDRRFIPVGLYMNDIAVGFAMYGAFPHEEEQQRVWLDRYLIDERYQHQGLGKHFMHLLLQHIINRYNCSQLFLSVYETNEVAIQLYKKFGFVFNGELDENGEKVMVKEISRHDNNESH
ncbi:GNAT family N-acetyltransferase [Sporosarcina sp. Te-1]|uniref:GNAT family N-acetyltransferase n=1 Tax=Sporosarcina sp. Te-1 TaxID=2818390 RepID=UPI001A9E81A6|nr:GNAT family N-acetyltransferase [Sporosarcina sp. Te-1]QTD40676.1 GNAT family N-acetyltransferase [Sporosarcina sp. Te-1]